MLPWGSLFVREWFFEDYCVIRKIFQDFSEIYAFGRSEKVVGGRSGLRILSGSGQIFRTSKGFKPLERQGRWLDVGEVSSVVDIEGKSVKYHNSVGIWSDFSGLPRGLSFSKVKEGGWRPERSQGYGS